MTTESPFAGARSGFLKPTDFEGRLLVVEVIDYKTGLPSDLTPGKTYDAAICNVTVLDGPVSDKFETIPCTIDATQLAGAALEPQLRPFKGKSYPKNVVYGRMTAPISQKYNKPAPRLAEPTAEDTAKVIAWANTRDPFAS